MGKNDGAADDLSPRGFVPRDDGREAMGNGTDLCDSHPHAGLGCEMGRTESPHAMAAQHTYTTEVDSERGGTPPGAFEGDVRDLLRLLDRFTRKPQEFALRAHPIFGAMTEAEWMRWGYLHMDHHLRQFGA